MRMRVENKASELFLPYAQAYRDHVVLRHSPGTISRIPNPYKSYILAFGFLKLLLATQAPGFSKAIKSINHVYKLTS